MIYRNGHILSRDYQARLLILLMGIAMLGCYQEMPSKKPPIHLNPNMDDQPKYQAQAESQFFANGQAMRMPVPGTIARGSLHENVVYYTGKDLNGNLVNISPVKPTLDVLKRGQNRYEIYCTPCHGRVGDGTGIVVKRGMFPPPTYHQERLRVIGDGHIFDVITNGIRNMPSYRAQVPVSDRWAIVNYVRALQRSQNAAAKDVPANVKASIK